VLVLERYDPALHATKIAPRPVALPPQSASKLPIDRFEWATWQEIVRRIMGDENPEDVLDRMIANGEIAEHQRGDVRFIRTVIIVPVWEMGADGSAKLVGRRNVHTGEVELVDGWGSDRPDDLR
jgi:hypothetical protein